MTSMFGSWVFVMSFRDYFELSCPDKQSDYTTEKDPRVDEEGMSTEVLI